MGYFNDEENVMEYIKMAEGFDGRELIAILNRFLDPGSSVLELGMGPGKDLDILGEDHNVTGSDLSKVFIDMYRSRKPGADLLILDAVKMDTERKFDCIYSNKVLHHLTREELRSSFLRQHEVLNEGGILFHSFWKGDRDEVMMGLLFAYYTEEKLVEIIDGGYEILDMGSYREMEDDDSIYIVLKKLET